MGGSEREALARRLGHRRRRPSRQAGGERNLLTQDERVVGQEEAERVQVLAVEQVDRDLGLSARKKGVGVALESATGKVGRRDSAGFDAQP